MATHKVTDLTPEHAAHLVKALEDVVWERNVPAFTVPRILNAERAFRVLEGQWRRDPTVLRPHIQRLKTLREALSALRTVAIREIVNAMAATKEARERAERQEETLRAVLIHYFKDTGETKPAGTQQYVSIAPRTATRIPKVATEDRLALEGLLKSLGRWDDVVMMSASRLSQLLPALSEAERLQIQQFCPQYSTYAVSVRGAKPREASQTTESALEYFQKDPSRTMADVHYLFDRLGALSPELSESAQQHLLSAADEIVAETLEELKASVAQKPRANRWADIDAICREYGGDPDSWGQSSDFE